jgi:hypothetical protein
MSNQEEYRPEQEPISYMDEYILALEGLEDDDGLRCGFTGVPCDF